MDLTLLLRAEFVFTKNKYYSMHTQYSTRYTVLEYFHARKAESRLHFNLLPVSHYELHMGSTLALE